MDLLTTYPLAFIYLYSMLWKRLSCKPSRTYPQALPMGYAIVLLGLYMLAFLVPQGDLPHVHSRPDLHAGDSCRKDACHIAIFHPGDKGGCHHKFHLTQADESCPFCHWSLTFQEEPPVAGLRSVMLPAPVVVFDPIPCPVVPFTILHADRGPPAA